MYIFSVDKCRELDRYFIENIGMPSIVLMENAANEVTTNIINKASSFIVICGVGNNGGDGLAIARKLLLNNKLVKILIIGDEKKCSVNFSINMRILKGFNCDIEYITLEEDYDKLKILLMQYEAIVDCIFGVGLNRTLNNFYINVINIINNSKAIRISVDVPSGLNSDTGIIMGNAIKADYTYTFEVIKKGFIEYKALEYLGDVQVLNIGIPKTAKDIHSVGIETLEKAEYSKILKVRQLYGHKGSYGKAIIFAGSKGYTGAAYISTEACVMAGTGLTTLITSAYVQEVLSSKLAEAMTLDINCTEEVLNVVKKANVISFGPGLRKSQGWDGVLVDVVNNSKCNIVIDAEGLNIISERTDILKSLKGRAILTPHPGEMARLIGKTVDYVENNRIDVAKRYAKENNIVLVLKGYNTLITNGDVTYVNTTGNSKMASGGMGDCLTGIITSLLAQKHSLLDSALLGVYIHGLAGEQAGECKYSVVATKVIEEIPKIMGELSK